MGPRLKLVCGGPAVDLPPFHLSDGSGEPLQQTRVRVAADVHVLRVEFDCDDDDVWGTHTTRDAPLYEEECVEIFLAPGEDPPRRYCEIEVSPGGCLFDAIIDNPTGRREEMTADTRWDAPGLTARAERTPGGWRAAISLPWAGVLQALEWPLHPLPAAWRINFFRIERPRGRPAEFSCWSPTGAHPPNFHVPERMGWMEVERPG